MSKVLVIIEDKEKFLGEILNSLPMIDRLRKIIQNYEQDVIEFKATVYKVCGSDTNRIMIPEDTRVKLMEGEKYQVLMVKKKEE